MQSIFFLCGAPSYIHSDWGLRFLAHDVKEYLLLHGVASSKTTPYLPQSNAQVERYHSIIGQTICLILKSQNLPITHWELDLPLVLHSIRSILFTATNATPYERFFSFFRQSSMGVPFLSWLLKPGPVFLRKTLKKWSQRSWTIRCGSNLCTYQIRWWPWFICVTPWPSSLPIADTCE